MFGKVKIESANTYVRYEKSEIKEKHTLEALQLLKPKFLLVCFRTA